MLRAWKGSPLERAQMQHKSCIDFEHVVDLPEGSSLEDSTCPFSYALIEPSPWDMSPDSHIPQAAFLWVTMPSNTFWLPTLSFFFSQLASSSLGDLDLCPGVFFFEGTPGSDSSCSQDSYAMTLG